MKKIVLHIVYFAYALLSLLLSLLIVVLVVLLVFNLLSILKCLYSNLRVSPFVDFSSSPCWGRRGGVSGRLSSAELPAAGLNYNTTKTHYLQISVPTGRSRYANMPISDFLNAHFSLFISSWKHFCIHSSIFVNLCSWRRLFM